MEQPLFWIFLALSVMVGVAARLAYGGPLLQREAVPIGRMALGIAGAAVLALAIHCAVMFFASWTDAVTGGRTIGRAIRDLGPTSQWAYWLPSAALLLSLRRVWWPGIVLLGVTLAGVGITMFWPHPLRIHLICIAGAVLSLTLVVACLVSLTPHDPPHRASQARAD